MKKISEITRDLRVVTSGSSMMLSNATGKLSRDSRVARQQAGNKIRSAGEKARAKMPW